MNIFLSNFTCNIDKKYRTSVPVSFRAVLAKQESNGFIAYPSFRNPCIEGCSMDRLKALSKTIASLDPYSQERDAFETVILGQAVQILFDAEGRISLPSDLLEHAQITNQVCFVGKGLTFEIWQPQKFEKYLVDAKKIALANKLTLKN